MNDLCFVAMKETYHTKESGSYTSYAICVEELTPKGRVNILTVLSCFFRLIERFTSPAENSRCAKS